MQHQLNLSKYPGLIYLAKFNKQFNHKISESMTLILRSVDDCARMGNGSGVCVCGGGGGGGRGG